MKFLSENESLELIRDKGYSFDNQEQLRKLIFRPRSFALAKDVSKLTYTSFHIFDQIDYSEILLLISNWSIWKSSENLHLFYGYRKHLGEFRELIDCPGQIFNFDEKEHFFCLFSVSLYNAWDGYIMIDEKLCVRFTNDEFIEIDENSDLGKKIVDNVISFNMIEKE